MTYVTLSTIVNFFILADNIKFFCVINSPQDCLLLQSCIKSTSDRCAVNSTRLNIAKTRVLHILQEDKYSELRVTALSCYHYKHQQYEGLRCFL
jgi:hypothetical protein